MGEVIPKIRRPDPARLVKVSGPLTVAAAGRVAIALRQLAQASAEPITLLIQSSGGEVEAFYQLIGTIDTLQLAGKKCRVFTVVRNAGSAAAYLLLAGHRAFALPAAKVGLHGTRSPLPKNGKPLSREKALAMAMRLDRENRTVARILAKHLIFRLAARQRELRSLSAHSLPHAPAAMLKNLTQQLSVRLDSARAKRMLNESFERLKMILALSPRFPTEPRSTTHRSLATGEARAFQMAIAFELEANRGEKWRLDGIAGAELLMDYLLAKDFLPGDHLKLVRRIAKNFSQNFLTNFAATRYEKLKQQDLTQAEAYLIKAALPGALGLWYFTMTLCHRLLTGEHTFTAQDAYWLGLVDEVLPAEFSLA